MRRIARELKLHYRTVERYVRSDMCPDWTAVRRPDRRTDEEREWAGRLKELDLELRRALEGVEDFARLVRERNGAGLDDWLNLADAIPTLRAFAGGLRRDEAAGRSGLTLAWSNGPVEGAVNRLKLLKRAGYGRAKFGLLRARILSAG